MSEYSIDNLFNFFNKNNYLLVNTYSLSGVTCFFHIINEKTSDNLIINVPNKYSMKHKNSLELIKFTDLNDTNNYFSSGDYKELDLKNMEDDNYFLDKNEADKILEQYQEIEIDNENIDILKNNIISYKSELERLKTTTKNIKYKICILSQSSLSYIDRDNKIYCYALKKNQAKQNEFKNLYLITNLENFYEDINQAENDISQVYKKLYNTIKEVNIQQTLILNSRLKQYKDLDKKINNIIKKRDEYETNIQSLIDILKDIDNQEKKLRKNFSSLSDIKNLSIKKDIEKINTFKKESINLLLELKSEYNSFVINLDLSISTSIKLFKIVSDKFTDIGIISKKNKNS